MIDQRLRFRRLTVIFSLLFTCVGLAILAPGRAQEGTQGDLYTIVVPAGDSMALALAIINQPPQPAADTPTTHIYLEGGVYTFSFPGSASHPQFPLVAGRMVIHGNEATIRLENYAPEMVITVDAGAEVTFEQVTLQFESPQGRSILNRGKLSLIDSSLINDSGAPAYTQGEGGGIENRGELHLTRVTLRGLRVVSSSDPGGAITNAGTLGASCVHFAHNRASQGGAVYNAPGGSAQISLSVFEGNRANGGGAIYNAEGNADLEATHNFWGGGEPGIDDWMWGMDTISGRVLYAPVLASDPLTSPECAVPPEQTPTAPAGGTGNPPSPASVVLPVPLVNAPLAFMSDFYKLTIGVVEPGGVYRSEPWADGAVLDTPVWSPDGRRVAYASIRSGNAEVYILDLISHQEINVSQTLTHYDTQPVWSADGSKLAFASRQRASGQSSRLIVVDKDGTNAQILPLRPAEAGYASSPSSPSWAPDGNRLFFIASSYLFWIETTFPDVPHQVSIFHPTLGYPLYVDGVAHAPQGAQILLSAAYWGGGGFAPPGYNLFLANEDGSGVQQGAYLSDPLYPAVWSPDGSQIVFRKRVNTQENLYLLNRAAFGLSNGSLLATQVFGGGVWRVSLAQATPTPTPTLTPTYPPIGQSTPGFTPTRAPILCNLTTATIPHLFRAPIEGNPAWPHLESSIAIVKRIDAYAVDPLRNTLWFHIAPPENRLTNQMNPAYPHDAVTPWWGWARVISSSGQGFTVIEGSRFIVVPKQRYPSNAVRGLDVRIEEIENCLRTLPDASNQYILPDLVQASWTNAPFTFFPISAASMCQWSSIGLGGNFQIPGTTPVPRSKGVQIFGFALEDQPAYGDLRPSGYHPGVDFFAFADRSLNNANYPARGAAVYSIANKGLVVGIGLGRRIATPSNPPRYKTQLEGHSSSASWGAVTVTDPAEVLTYNVVIRYGSRYVLYGHIRELDPAIYVGKLVTAGTRLGIIGTFNTPHVHIEVRTFGLDLNSPPEALLVRVPSNPLQTDLNYVRDTNLFGNKYGILALSTDRGGQGDDFGTGMVSLHDFAQLFQGTVYAHAQDFDSGASPQVVITG